MGQGSSSPDQDQDEVKVRVQVDPKKVPIVYSDAYNIGFWNIEKLHPFDSRKYEKVFNGLLASKMLTAERFYKPYRVSDQELLRVHTHAYLDSLKSSTEVARIIEVPPVAMLPNGLVQTKALDPMRYATGGTLVASELALHYGWAINLSGGYHHASAEHGGGFCVFADISLALLSVHQAHPELTRFMIVDLDAHQGNGHGTDKVNGVFQGLDVHIFDMYNHKIYPRDHQAAQGIDTRIKLEHHIDDRQYLELLRLRLEQAVQSHKPQFILYNAGTDCLIGDPLGVMDITAEGIMARDEIVFATALAGKIPVAMVLSGGYQKNNAAVITESILNLNEKHNLFGIQPKL